jgi:hypothetical protein
MATNTVSNYWKYKMLNNYVAKVFAVLLMQPGFVFDKDAHLDYADISASECTTANGYTKGTGLVLTISAVSQDNTNDRGKIAFSNVSFTPTPGNISLGGALIWDVTDDIIVGYEDADGTITINADQPYVFTNLEIRNN